MIETFSFVKSLVEKFGFDGVLIILVVLIVLIIVLYLISVLTGRAFKLKIGPIDLSLGGEKQAIQPKKLKCNKENMVKMLLTSKEKFDHESLNIEQSILKRDLAMAEQKLIQVKNILMFAFANILKTKMEENNINTHKDYRSYQILLTMLLKSLKDNIEETFISNHFDSMSEEQWKRYVDGKAQFLLDTKTDFLDNMFGENTSITRYELKLENSKYYEQLREIFRQIYIEAKEIGQIERKDLKNLEQIFTFEIEEIVNDNMSCPFVQETESKD